MGCASASQASPGTSAPPAFPVILGPPARVAWTARLDNVLMGVLEVETAFVIPTGSSAALVFVTRARQESLVPPATEPARRATRGAALQGCQGQAAASARRDGRMTLFLSRLALFVLMAMLWSVGIAWRVIPTARPAMEPPQTTA